MEERGGAKEWAGLRRGGVKYSSQRILTVAEKGPGFCDLRPILDLSKKSSQESTGKMIQQ